MAATQAQKAIVTHTNRTRRMGAVSGPPARADGLKMGRELCFDFMM